MFFRSRVPTETKQPRDPVCGGKMPLCAYSVNAARVSKHVRPPLTTGTHDVAGARTVTDTVTSGRARRPISIVPRRKQIAVKTSRGTRDMRFEPL